MPTAAAKRPRRASRAAARRQSSRRRLSSRGGAGSGSPSRADGGSSSGGAVSMTAEEMREVELMALINKVKRKATESEDERASSEGTKRWLSPLAMYAPLDDGLVTSGGPTDDGLTVDDILNRPLDMTSNWPASCPFVHQDFANDFLLRQQSRFVRSGYRCWWFLVFTLLVNALATVVTHLFSAVTDPSSILIAFGSLLGGYWLFFYMFFRMLYNAIRLRSECHFWLFQLFALVLIGLSAFNISSAIGNIMLVVEPLAPGSAVPVRLNPTLPVIAGGATTFLWLILLFWTFFLVRKSCYWRGLLPEKLLEMVREERKPSALSAWITSVFSAEPDSKKELRAECSLAHGELMIAGSLRVTKRLAYFRARVSFIEHSVTEVIPLDCVASIAARDDSLHLQLLPAAVNDLLAAEYVFVFDSPEEAAAAAAKASKLFKKWYRCDRKRDDDQAAAYVQQLSQQARDETDIRRRLLMLARSDWLALMRISTMAHYSAGDVIIAEGQPADKLLYVMTGSVRVERTEGAALRKGVSALGDAFADSKDDLGEAEEKSSGGESDSVASGGGSSGSGGGGGGNGEGEIVLELGEGQDIEDLLDGVGGILEQDYLYAKDMAGLMPWLLDGGSSSVSIVADGESDVVEIDVELLAALLTASELAPDGAVDDDGIEREAFSVAAWYKYIAIALGLRMELVADAIYEEKAEEAVDGGSMELVRATDGERVAALPATGFATKRGLNHEVRERFSLGHGDDLVKQFEGSFIQQQPGGRQLKKGKGSIFLTLHHICCEQSKRLLREAVTMRIPMDAVLGVLMRETGGVVVELGDHSELILQSKEGSELLSTLTVLWKNSAELAATVAESKRRVSTAPDASLAAAAAAAASSGVMAATRDAAVAAGTLPRPALSLLAREEQRHRSWLKSVLTAEDVSALFSGIPVRAKRNHAVIRTDKPLRGMYRLEEGRLRVQRSLHGQRVLLYYVEPGEIVGMEALLTGAPPSSAVFVDSDTATLRYLKLSDDFEQRLADAPSRAARLFRYMAIVLAERLERISRMLDPEFMMY
eukprot:PLAT3818.2.p1 GENE.PLAT3818.2~~PLAT3818.2.p1  ORF type:complete len:1047 (+),score=589.51 PLAT3818.2:24-3164(+)